MATEQITQADEWATYLDSLPADQKARAEMILLTYCVGDIPEEVFRCGMERVKRSLCHTKLDTLPPVLIP